MLRILTIMIMALLLSSCGASKRLPIESQKDSISVVIKESVIYKDSLIYVEVPAESQSVVLPDTDTSHLETSLAESEAWVTDGKLNHTLRHKPNKWIPKIVTIPYYARTEEVKSLAEMVVIKEVEKPLNWWQNLRMGLGTLFLIGVILYVLMKAIKAAVL